MGALMTKQEIFEYIAIFSLIWMFLGFFYNITAQKLSLWFLAKAETINKFAYTTVVVISTSGIVYGLIVFPITKQIFDIKWALLLGVCAYFIFAMWLYVLKLQKRRLGQIEKIHINVNRWAAVAFLTGFWIVSWPTQWLVPLILTCIYSVIMIILYLRWRAGRMQSSSIAKPNNR